VKLHKKKKKKPKKGLADTTDRCRSMLVGWVAEFVRIGARFSRLGYCVFGINNNNNNNNKKKKKKK
jgi:hypothetical protein